MLSGVKRVGPLEWEVPIGFTAGMRVSGRFFLSEELTATLEEGSVRQLANVATMPGIVGHALAMPDIHWGYGFPIGGVAAFDVNSGVISPGGVGFDINCGVRLMTTPLVEKDLEKNKRELIEEIFRVIPTGVGTHSSLKLSNRDLHGMMVDGAGWAVEQGFGMASDLVHCEDRGMMKPTEPDAVSAKARQRGLPQGGTLGAGNHFLEIQVVREILDPGAAAAYGIEKGQICCMIHCGSRGLGHQVCTDHLKILEKATKKYQITLPDRQLACAPVHSPEGRSYFGAMACAANYAWTNRQIIMHRVRELLQKMYRVDYEDMNMIYDVAHNVAKFEQHTVGGEKMDLCVHRKGATRAFGPGAPDIPADYADTGQPVIIPGSMGTSSYLLRGTATAMERTFGSTCHGAGRVVSRAQAKKDASGKEIREQLAQAGIYVRSHHDAALAEEAPDAYKPSSEVVRVVDSAGLSKIVARLEPLGVIKG